MVTEAELRAMDANEVIRRLEARLGKEIPIEDRLTLAVMLGARDTGVMVMDPTPDCGGTHHETLDFVALAALLNENPAA